MSEDFNVNPRSADTFEDLIDRFSQQCRDGSNPAIESIAAEFPEHAETIRELFPAIEAMEWLGAADDSKKRLQQAQAKFDLNQPESIGDFKIIEEIGRGGMGIVYKAVQQSLERPVAIKILLRSSIEPKQIVRFEREAATAAKLHHTNIVPVFGVGHQDGFHYYVMQLIEGVGLDQILVALRNPAIATLSPKLKSIVAKLRQPNDDQSDFSPKTAASDNAATRNYCLRIAAYARTIAGAVGYAHAQGTLHRDIKPGNLLVDTDDNIWLADFGLAKAAESQDLSRTGDVVGTMRYMAPEQFAGSPDRRSDVYGLGLTIYEMITLKPAYDSLSQIHFFSGPKSSRLAIKSLQDIAPDTPTDLATIIMKACELNPEDRYQSAIEFESDLDNFLNDRPISARPPSSIEKTLKWCRRNPLVASLVGLAAALLVVIAGISTNAYARSEAALVMERNQRTQLEIEQRRVKNLQVKTEQTLDISLAALDRIFDRLTPDITQSELATTVEGAGGESFVIRSQPVLSTDTVALLDDMLVTYDRLAKIQVDAPRLAFDSARASQRVGEIQRELGALEESAEAFGLAIEKYDSLAQSDLEIAKITRALGDIYRRLKQDEKSKQAFQRSLRLLENLDRNSDSLSRDHVDIKLELARTQYFLAKRLPPSFDNKPPRPSGIFGGLFSPPTRSPRRRKSDKQLKYLAQAKESLSKLLKLAPNNAQAKYLLALCCREESRPGINGGRETAIEILRQLIQEQPTVTAFQFELAETLNPMGPHNGRNRRQQSDDLEECKAILTDLVTQHPNIPRYQRSLFHAYHKSGMSMAKRPGKLTPDDEAVAIGNLQLAMKTQQRLAQTFPDSIEFKYWLAKTSANLAGVLERSGDADEAIQLNQKGVALAKVLVKEKTAKVPALHLLIELHHNLEHAYRRNGQVALADSSNALAKSFASDLPKRIPTD